MTRAEVIYEIEDFNEYSPNNNPTRIVNEIYDDFESKVCTNCEYHNGKLMICENYSNNRMKDGGVSTEKGSYLMADNDFGCNKFERID